MLPNRSADRRNPPAGDSGVSLQRDANYETRNTRFEQTNPIYAFFSLKMRIAMKTEPKQSQFKPNFWAAQGSIAEMLTEKFTSLRQ